MLLATRGGTAGALGERRPAGAALLRRAALRVRAARVRVRPAAAALRAGALRGVRRRRDGARGGLRPAAAAASEASRVSGLEAAQAAGAATQAEEAQSTLDNLDVFDLQNDSDKQALQQQLESEVEECRNMAKGYRALDEMERLLKPEDIEASQTEEERQQTADHMRKVQTP